MTGVRIYKTYRSSLLRMIKKRICRLAILVFTFPPPLVAQSQDVVAGNIGVGIVKEFLPDIGRAVANRHKRSAVVSLR
jgi:hypothetical protein